MTWSIGTIGLLSAAVHSNRLRLTSVARPAQVRRDALGVALSNAASPRETVNSCQPGRGGPAARLPARSQADHTRGADTAGRSLARVLRSVRRSSDSLGQVLRVRAIPARLSTSAETPASRHAP